MLRGFCTTLRSFLKTKNAVDCYFVLIFSAKPKYKKSRIIFKIRLFLTAFLVSSLLKNDYLDSAVYLCLFSIFSCKILLHLVLFLCIFSSYISASFDTAFAFSGLVFTGCMADSFFLSSRSSRRESLSFVL